MLHFAVAGTPHSTPKPGGTVNGLKQAHALGITAMEIEWVQRVPTNPERLEEIRATAEELGIALTVHAPYFINMNALEEKKIINSKNLILLAMESAQAVGARSVCVHPAFYMKMDPKIAYENVRRHTDELMVEVRKRGLTVNLAYETMGKPTQFGSLKEVLKLSKEFGLYPCIDPDHMHARTNGEWNTTKEWNTMFDLYVEYLGKKALKHVHMHYSGILYTEKGERKHLPLLESDANWHDFVSVLSDRGIEGNVVCESPLLEEDTLRMQQNYVSM